MQFVIYITHKKHKKILVKPENVGALRRPLIGTIKWSSFATAQLMSQQFTQQFAGRLEKSNKD